MSAFKENDEYDPKNFVETEFGFALQQEEMPKRHDVFWKQMPSGHIYTFDGDGWLRLKPPEPKLYPPGDLKHG